MVFFVVFLPCVSYLPSIVLPLFLLSFPYPVFLTFPLLTYSYLIYPLCVVLPVFLTFPLLSYLCFQPSLCCLTCVSDFPSVVLPVFLTSILLSYLCF